MGRPVPPRTSRLLRFVWICLGLPLLLLLQACPPRWDGGPEVPVSGEELRLIVQTADETDPVVVGRRVARFFGEDTRVERLFEGVDPAEDTEGLALMFLVFVPQSVDRPENSWDLARELQEELDFVRVEPDFENTLVAPTEAARSFCFEGDGEPPEDKGWSLVAMAVKEAWAVPPEPGGAARGAGVSICHPDTGWSEHVDLDASNLDLARARNILHGSSDAQDPLDYPGNPGHGTSTGSVLVSQGDLDAGGGTTPPGSVTGVAPEATLVPIRTAKSVVQVFDSDLAKSVRHAVEAECDVISMSLGGRALFGLKAAIRDAVKNDLIVAAAAGNCVKFVVAPAVYRDCIAVAATNVDDEPWKGSSRGKAVGISAPGEDVWRAKKELGDPGDRVAPGKGTSFAVASAAGVAALWLAHHGLETFDRAYRDRGIHRQDVFLQLLRKSARTPDNWRAKKYGHGIVNAKKLLEEELPSAEEVTPVRRAPLVEDDTLEILELAFDRDREELRAALAQLFEVSPDEVEERLTTWGGELIHIAMGHPEVFSDAIETLESEDTTATARRSARSRLAALASEALREEL